MPTNITYEIIIVYFFYLNIIEIVFKTNSQLGKKNPKIEK